MTGVHDGGSITAALIDDGWGRSPADNMVQYRVLVHEKVKEKAPKAKELVEDDAFVIYGMRLGSGFVWNG